MSPFRSEVYSTREIALAAGVPHERVVAALGRSDLFLGHDEAVRLGRSLVAGDATLRSNSSTARPSAARPTLFASVTEGPAPGHSKGVSLAVSSTVHAGLIAGAIFLATFGMSPKASALATESQPAETLRLVYLNIPGPGGGGGGGGLRQPRRRRRFAKVGRRSAARAPSQATAESRAGRRSARATSSAARGRAAPVLVAPIISAPADTAIGSACSNRRRPRYRATARAGRRRGNRHRRRLGSGDGSGIGPGSGGGTGGGPFRPGRASSRRACFARSRPTTPRTRGAAASRVKSCWNCRQPDGSVGDVRILKGLGAGLNDRAIQAVRQWRFAPATRQGSPVDVIVEVAVEFKLR